MLVNLKIKPGQRTKYQKKIRELLNDPYFTGPRFKQFRDDMRSRMKHFNWVLMPYKPCGLEYVKDTTSDFTGVYIDGYGYGESYITAMTYNSRIETASFHGYGNVDNASQAIVLYHKEKRKHPEYLPGNHIILLNPIVRGAGDGYRWSHNGYYQGEADAGNCECFGDETEELKLVYQYQFIQVSFPKEEDFGDDRLGNFGRIPSIRKLRMMGLTNLAAYAKTCPFVMCSEHCCQTHNESDEWTVFDFEHDNYGKIVAVTPRNIAYGKYERLTKLPELDWTK